MLVVVFAVLVGVRIGGGMVGVRSGGRDEGHGPATQAHGRSSSVEAGSVDRDNVGDGGVYTE
jgi:hypothetical protein